MNNGTLDLLLRQAAGEEPPAGADLVRLLELNEPEELAALFDTAYEVKRRYVGTAVRLRGLIEVSNFCARDCYYCGIRRGNAKIRRFQLERDEILSAARRAYEFGYGSIVLQGGERGDDAFVGWIEELLREIKRLSGGGLGITLSLGEQDAAAYRRWFAAGAHRYLLRIESSNPDLFAAIHPPEQSFAARLRCLELLRDAGYQVGTGVMCNLPGQTAADLAADIEFFAERDIDMIGMGPYIPHRDTPMGGHAVFDSRQALLLGLKMIAVTRLKLRDVNIAATTALQALAPDGREQGLLAGANVVMPNIGGIEYREDYALYDGKPSLDENADGIRRSLEKSIAAIGEHIEYGAWGDSPHFARRSEEKR